MPLQAILFQASLQQRINREHLEELRIHLGHRALDLGSADGDDLVFLPVADAADRLRLRNLGIKLGLVPPGKSHILFITHCIHPVADGILMGNAVLLPDIVPNQNDKGDGYHQPHRLDGGVEVIAG